MSNICFGVGQLFIQKDNGKYEKIGNCSSLELIDERNDKMEFKVGDKVRIIANKDIDKHYFTIGEIVKIVDFDGRRYIAKNENDSCYVRKDDIELVQDTIEYDNKKYNVTKCDDKVLIAKRLNEPILDEEDIKTIKMGADLLIRCGSKPENIKVSKQSSDIYEYIDFEDINDEAEIITKSFEKGKMYENMEIDKEYTLKELGLK